MADEPQSDAPVPARNDVPASFTVDTVAPKDRERLDYIASLLKARKTVPRSFSAMTRNSLQASLTDMLVIATGDLVDE